MKNNEGKGGGLNREGKLINFLPLKRGLNREFTVAQFMQLFMVYMLTGQYYVQVKIF